MAEYYVHTAMPEDLLFKANEIARMQGIPLSHLLVEALSDTVEGYQQHGWVAERTAPQFERTFRAGSARPCRSSKAETR